MASFWSGKEIAVAICKPIKFGGLAMDEGNPQSPIRGSDRCEPTISGAQGGFKPREMSEMWPKRVLSLLVAGLGIGLQFHIIHLKIDET
jgi:hypothetical protein